MPTRSEVVSYLRDKVSPSGCGIIFSGSAIRDSIIPAGDLDVVVVITEQWIQKSKERWNGLVLDIQIASAEHYAEKLLNEQQSGLVGLIATGHIEFDESSLAHGIQRLSRDLWARPPLSIPFERYYVAQRATTLIERAERYASKYPLVAQSLLADALGNIFRLASLADNIWPDAFQTEYLRRIDVGEAGILLRKTDLGDVVGAITNMRRLLELATGKSFEENAMGSTPRIRTRPAT